MPAVSIVVPSFNAAPYLGECLDSILSQTSSDWEAICIDDGSSDATPDVLARYAAKDPRIKWLSQENRGLSASRNRGADLSSGTYLLFCDADDKLKPDTVRSLVETAERENLDVLLYGGETFFDEESLEKEQGNYKDLYACVRDLSSPRSGSDLLSDLVECGEYRSSACLQLIRRGHLERSGVRFFDGVLHEDNLFTFVNLLSAERAARVNDPWYLRRMRRDSIMTSAPGLRNVVGYAVCAREMFRFLQDHPQQARAEDACALLVKSMIGACRRIFDSLSPEEAAKLERLPPVDRLWIDTVRRSRPEREFLALRNRAKALAERLDRRDDELRRLRRSPTYRVGSALFFLPRAVCRLIKK